MVIKTNNIYWFQPALKAKDKAYNNYGSQKEGKCFTMLHSVKLKEELPEIGK